MKKYLIYTLLISAMGIVLLAGMIYIGKKYCKIRRCHRSKQENISVTEFDISNIKEHIF